ncbi:Methyltransferase type 11, partial [Metarhizium majus ARSEF 297]
MRNRSVDEWLKDIVTPVIDYRQLDVLLHSEQMLNNNHGAHALEAGGDDLDATRRPPAAKTRSTTSQSSHPADSSDCFSVELETSATASSFLPPVCGARATQFPSRPLIRRTPSPTKRLQRSRHASSPTKRVKTTASLLGLERPVDVKKASANQLPADIRQLYEELFAVSNKEGILPQALKDSRYFDEETRPFMWESDEVPSSLGSENAEKLHKNIKKLVAKAIESANIRRSEAAFNTMVHFPFLELLLEDISSVGVEVVSSAQIAKVLRPPWKETTFNDETSSTISSVSSTGTGCVAQSFVHNMVDYALVLHPDNELSALIDKFLDSQLPECTTINQTMYEPLCRLPAPISIETKTATGNSAAANRQLGVWVAGYHQRLRSIFDQRSGGADMEPIITLPVSQWYDGLFMVLFAADIGSGIDILDVDLKLGGCNSILGAYQLRKALICLASYVNVQFKSWLFSLLRAYAE